MICDPQKEDKKGPHTISFPMDEDAKLDTKRLRKLAQDLKSKPAKKSSNGKKNGKSGSKKCKNVATVAGKVVNKRCSGSTFKICRKKDKGMRMGKFACNVAYNVLIGLRTKGTLKCKKSPPLKLRGNKKAKKFAKQLINRKCKKVKTSCKKSGVKGCSCKFAINMMKGLKKKGALKCKKKG